MRKSYTSLAIKSMGLLSETRIEAQPSKKQKSFILSLSLSLCGCGFHHPGGVTKREVAGKKEKKGSSGLTEMKMQRERV